MACVASVSMRGRSVIKVLLLQLSTEKTYKYRNACCSKILLLLFLLLLLLLLLLLVLLQAPICSRINSWFQV